MASALMQRSIRTTAGLLVTIAVALLAACSSLSTQRGFYKPITQDVENGDYSAAVAKLEKAREDKKYAEKDRFLYFVDAGMANHYAGNYETSNQKLQLAEVTAEELFTRSISRAAMTLLLNDNVLEYAGEDYEILYTNIVKALNYIALNDFDGAFVEVRRANEKLQLLDQKYADAAVLMQRGQEQDTTKVPVDYEPEHVRFYNDAFARYLSMRIYAAEGKLDDARIDYNLLQEAFEAQPYVYSFPAPEIKYYSEDRAVLSVVALVGLGPTKEAFSLRIRTDKDLNLVQVLYTNTEGDEVEYGHLPMPVSEDYYFKFAIPRVEARASEVGHIRVLASGRELGELQLLEDVSLVAKETFRAKRSLIYLRSVARAVAKGLAAHKLKEKADTGGLDGWLKKAAIDVGTDITENADLRSTQLLPGRVLVGDFEVEPGTYDLIVEFYTRNSQLIARHQFDGYTVTPTGLNLIQAVQPN
jgi:hypothetical protein